MRRRRTSGGWAVTSAALAIVLTTATSAAAAPSSTGVIAAPAATTVGSPVQLTATVTCGADPSGGLGMSFFDGGDLLDTVLVGVDGQATYSASFSWAGTHNITAAYNGNGACDASSSTTTVQVSASPTPSTPSTPGFPGLCLLTCGGLFGFTTGDITNNVIIH
ncbi:Ig-like domain-containing protein [Streptomyces sp. NPDC002553]|uniref:Ig-like domain-containing protein n=1 Tax=Streptomyces sp. NPDC002553 TaxID=3154417 RepID=UPI003333BA51